MIKRITMEEFEMGIKVERILNPTTNVAIYKGRFKHYAVKIKLNVDDHDDLVFLDDFAYEQLKRKLLDRMKGNV